MSRVIVAPAKSEPGMATVPVNCLNPPVWRPPVLVPTNSIFESVVATFRSAAVAKLVSAAARMDTLSVLRIWDLRCVGVGVRSGRRADGTGRAESGLSVRPDDEG